MGRDWVLLLGEAGDECEGKSIGVRCGWVDLEREKRSLYKKVLCASGTTGKSFGEAAGGM
jgi:hypothetical protein